MEFLPFPKIPRARRRVCITEKIDGTNAQVNIRLAGPETDSSDPFEIGYDIDTHTPDGLQAYMRFGSRNRWLPLPGAPGEDNYGFAHWGCTNATELSKLGVGAHFGEWYGSKIGRTYGLIDGDKRFALFNVDRWRDGRASRPGCCGVVPLLGDGIEGSGTGDVNLSTIIERLRTLGSVAVPGFMKPEGVVIWHTATRGYTKITLENDDEPKSKAKAA